MAKKKASSNKEEEEAVLKYLTKTNRPYSATDIFNNLHQKYTKTNIIKALEKLVEDDSVFSKVYGKSSIYSVKQTPSESTADTDLEAMSKTISDLTEQQEELSTENRKLDQELASIKSEPTTSEASDLLEKIQKENQLLQERLNKLKDGTVLIPPEKRKRTNDEFQTNRNLWKKRRGMFRDIFKTVTEYFPGNPNELKEQLGIEEDEIPFERDPLATATTSS